MCAYRRVQAIICLLLLDTYRFRSTLDIFLVVCYNSLRGVILENNKSNKRNKGKSLLVFPSDYTVTDIETNGMSPSDSEIIEISAIRYRGFKKSAEFTSLVKPTHKISRFITDLTGITNVMVKNAPDISEVIKDYYDFVGNDIIVGYNVNFDINFLYDDLLKYRGIILKNDFVDVLRFARKALPELDDRKQTSVASYYGISADGAHRALRDCEICNEVYLKLRQEEIFAGMNADD